MTPKRIAAACFSGLLMALAFPHWDLWPLAWVGLVPFLWAIRDRSVREAALLGCMGGTLHYTVLLYWLVGTMRSYGHLPAPLAVAAMVLLVVYLGAFWGLFGALARLVGSRLSIPLLAVAPPLWCALEGLRGVLFSGFPWALLGYSQSHAIPILQVADLTGIYGVSFVIVLVNSALAGTEEAAESGFERSWGVAAAGMGVALFVVGAALWYGNWRAPRVMAMSHAAPHLPVGIAQGSIDQSLKWDPASQESTLRLYSNQTKKMAEDGARLVVWPETAAPFFFQKEGELQDRLLDLARGARVEILFGAPAYGTVQGRRTFYNRAYLIGPGRDIRGAYDKMHLVPFGEYVPLQGILPFVRSMVTAIGDFSSGEGPRVLSSSTGAAIGVTICFESIFPEISRAFVRNGADLLANLTNDAWFGDTAAPHQHLAMLAMRAVESRRWIVRAANTGVSALIDPCGRVVARTPLFQPAVLVDTVPRLRIHSWYAVHGDRFLLACSIWAAGLIVFSRILARREGRRRDAIP